MTTSITDEMVQVRMLARPAWHSPLKAGDVARLPQLVAARYLASGIAETLDGERMEPPPRRPVNVDEDVEVHGLSDESRDQGLRTAPTDKMIRAASGILKRASGGGRRKRRR